MQSAEKITLSLADYASILHGMSCIPANTWIHKDSTGHFVSTANKWSKFPAVQTTVNMFKQHTPQDLAKDLVTFTEQFEHSFQYHVTQSSTEELPFDFRNISLFIPKAAGDSSEQKGGLQELKTTYRAYPEVVEAVNKLVEVMDLRKVEIDTLLAHRTAQKVRDIIQGKINNNSLERLTDNDSPLIPAQTKWDMPRIRSLKLNGKEIYQLCEDASQPSHLFPKACQDLYDAFQADGPRLAQRVMRLLVQSIFNDLVPTLYPNASQGHKSIGLTTSELFFDVDIKNDKVRIIAKTSFTAKVPEKEKEPMIQLGARNIKRVIEIPLSNLREDNLDTSQTPLPNLIVKEYFSPHYQDAEHAFERLKSF